MVNIDIQKRDLWLLSTIVVLLIGVGFVIAYDSGIPTTHGHANNEIEGVGFGDWQVMSASTTYTATTDGFVLAGDGSGLAYIETPVGTRRYEETQTVWSADSAWRHFGGMTPVKKGDTWQVIGFTTVYWIPLG